MSNIIVKMKLIIGTVRINLIPTGVGLIEAVVAIGILVTGIVSIVSLSENNLVYSRGVGDRLIAVNLAREGVEAVRSLRDDNWLNGRTNNSGQPDAWDSGFSNVTDATAIAVLNADTLEWTLDFTPNSITDGAARLRRHTGRGLYRQSLENPWPGEEISTPYTRLLTIYAICYDVSGDQETSNLLSCPFGWEKIGVRVISRVEWPEQGRRQGIEVESWLYNWRYGFSPYVN